MRVVFKIFPQDSHFNATLPLARQFRALGWEVVYAAYEERRASVESQGFAFHSQSTDLLPRLAPPSIEISAMTRARHIFGAWLRHARCIKDVIPADGFDQLIEDTRPHLILVDSPYARYSTALFKHNIPFAIIESMVRLDKRRGAPPLSSTYVPTGTLVSDAVCEILWGWYRLKVALLQMFHTYALPSRAHILRVLEKNGTPGVSVDFDRYFHVGIRDCPECILSPREFDFPGETKPNQLHLGPSVDLDRKDTGYDYFYLDRVQPMLRARDAGVPVVYCSLGSAAWRYSGIQRFFRRLVVAATGQPFSLILTIGQELDPRLFDPLPTNVAVIQRAPQIDLLRNADLAITHGGMNTITECIMLNVPMLVYPGTSELDQPGNAARVAYHRLGLMGSLRHERSADMRRKILTILGERGYRNRVADMAGAIHASHEARNGAEALLAALSSKHAT